MIIGTEARLESAYVDPSVLAVTRLSNASSKKTFMNYWRTFCPASLVPPTLAFSAVILSKSQLTRKHARRDNFAKRSWFGRAS